MTVAEIFGGRLKYLREHGLLYPMSQAQLAEKLNTSRASIGYYENASRTPDIEFLEAVASFFKVSYDYLLGKSDNEQRENIDIGNELGMSDRLINYFRSMNEYSKGKTDPQRQSYYKENYRILELLLVDGGFFKLCDYIRSVAFDSDGFLSCSIHKGDMDEWADARLEEIMSGHTPIASDKIAPVYKQWTVDIAVMKTLLLNDVAGELDKIRDQLRGDNNGNGETEDA